MCLRQYLHSIYDQKHVKGVLYYPALLCLFLSFSPHQADCLPERLDEALAGLKRKQYSCRATTSFCPHRQPSPMALTWIADRGGTKTPLGSKKSMQPSLLIQSLLSVRKTPLCENDPITYYLWDLPWKWIFKDDPERAVYERIQPEKSGRLILLKETYWDNSFIYILREAQN